MEYNVNDDIIWTGETPSLDNFLKDLPEMLQKQWEREKELPEPTEFEIWLINATVEELEKSIANLKTNAPRTRIIERNGIEWLAIPYLQRLVDKRKKNK